MIFYIPKPVLGEHLHPISVLSGWRCPASCTRAVLDSHPGLTLDGAGWAESTAAWCRAASKNPALCDSALTSNHCSIAWGKCRLPRNPGPDPVSPPRYRQRFAVMTSTQTGPWVSLLPLPTKGGPTPLCQRNCTCLVTRLQLFWWSASFPQCLGCQGGSSAVSIHPSMVDGEGLLLSLGQ